jgi:hypothetical protein
MRIPSAGAIADALILVLKRFPLPMLVALAGTVMACYCVEAGYDQEKPVIKWWMVAHLALPILIGLKAYAEAKLMTFRHSLILHALVVTIILGYAVTFKPFEFAADHIDIPRYILLLLAAHLWLSFAPFLGNESVEDFWEYNKQLLGNLVVGAALTLILYLGLCLAMLAVDNLFDFHIRDRAYARLFFVLAGIMNTAFFLFHFPKDFRFEGHEIKANLFFQVLCKYILIPVVGIYFLILYAYSGKIALTWSLPKGWVSSLVIGFAAVGILTWLLNFLLKKYDESVIFDTFDRYFWMVLFPMVGLLMLAVGRRIMDYGVTEERFFGAHTGSWLLLCCVFFVIVRSRDIRFIPMSLTAFILMGVYGPISGFELTRRSQKHRLQNLLEQNGMWAEGKARPATEKVPEEAYDQITSCLYALQSRGLLKDVEPWFEAQKLPADSLIEKGSYALDPLLKALKLERRSAAPQTEYLYLNGLEKQVLAVNGYDYYLRLDVEKQYVQETDREFSDTMKGYLWTSISQGGDSLILKEKNTELDRFALDSLLTRWKPGQTPDQYHSVDISNNEFVPLKGKHYVGNVHIEYAVCHKDSLHWYLNSLRGGLLLKKIKK